MDHDHRLAVRAFGLRFPHPVGLAAGFDKSAEAFAPLLASGFGHVEVGTLTPRPQAGNARPRVFRLLEDEALCNRYGFNNDGLEKGLERLRGRDPEAGIVGINLGINKESRDPLGDYAGAIRDAAAQADYLVVNVSSPNTPGLRDLQAADRLDALLAAAIAARDSGVGTGKPPVLLKISPDMTRSMVVEIVDVAAARGVAGLIVANTTVARPAGLRSRFRSETGGLSGKPLFQLATRVLAWTCLAAAGRLVVVGAGGIDGPAAAYAKIRAGASLLQIYTALVYKGPRLIGHIVDGLGRHLERDGHASIADAVGADAELWAEEEA